MGQQPIGILVIGARRARFRSESANCDEPDHLGCGLRVKWPSAEPLDDAVASATLSLRMPTGTRLRHDDAARMAVDRNDEGLPIPLFLTRDPESEQPGRGPGCGSRD